VTAPRPGRRLSRTRGAFRRMREAPEKSRREGEGAQSLQVCREKTRKPFNRGYSPF